MTAADPVRVLIVDDEPSILLLFETSLRRQGYEVEPFRNAEDAVAAFARSPHDVVLTDLHLPGMDGLDLMRAVRQTDLDVPVILVTASPSLDTAIRAVEYGAMQYLIKPVRPEEIVRVTKKAVYLGRLARLKREALSLLGADHRLVGDRAALEVALGIALAKLQVVYQPLVDWKHRRVCGYEALMRSGSPALSRPEALLDAAERLGRLHELGRAVRARAQEPFTGGDVDARLFLNLHPNDLLDTQLYDPDFPLSKMASNVVLEITERASLNNIGNVGERVSQLRALGYRIAVDDLGSGYAGLTTFSLLQPEVCKLDMALVRDVHSSNTKRRLVATMVDLCAELGIELVAEGVETGAELACLVDLGCNVFQGYYFSKPGRAFPAVTFNGE